MSTELICPLSFASGPRQEKHRLLNCIAGRCLFWENHRTDDGDQHLGCTIRIGVAEMTIIKESINRLSNRLDKFLSCVT